MWLAKQEWPDAKEMGKADKGQFLRAANLTMRRPRHTWTWQDPKWQCSTCGQLAKRKNNSTCAGGVPLDKVHRSHVLYTAKSPDPDIKFPVVFCCKCGGTKTASGRGLNKACRDMSAGAGVKRLKHIGLGRHPYSGAKWEVFGPLEHSSGQNGMGKVTLPICHRNMLVKPIHADSRAVPRWSDSPEWAVDEHVEACLGQGLVSSESVQEYRDIQGEVSELDQLDAELVAFQACTDNGQVVDMLTDPFEDDPFGHGAGNM